MQDNITDIEEKISGIKLDIQVLEEEKDRIKKQDDRAVPEFLWDQSCFRKQDEDI